MRKYIKRKVDIDSEVEAYQLKDDDDSIATAIEFIYNEDMSTSTFARAACIRDVRTNGLFVNEDIRGTIHVGFGDYIIKYKDGTIRVLTENTFLEYYKECNIGEADKISFRGKNDSIIHRDYYHNLTTYEKIIRCIYYRKNMDNEELDDNTASLYEELYQGVLKDIKRDMYDIPYFKKICDRLHDLIKHDLDIVYIRLYEILLGGFYIPYDIKMDLLIYSTGGLDIHMESNYCRDGNIVKFVDNICNKFYDNVKDIYVDMNEMDFRMVLHAIIFDSKHREFTLSNEYIKTTKSNILPD